MTLAPGRSREASMHILADKPEEDKKEKDVDNFLYF